MRASSTTDGDQLLTSIAMSPLFEPQTTNAPYENLAGTVQIDPDRADIKHKLAANPRSSKTQSPDRVRFSGPLTHASDFRAHVKTGEMSTQSIARKRLAASLSPSGWRLLRLRPAALRMRLRSRSGAAESEILIAARN